jgi:hypothetical protein
MEYDQYTPWKISEALEFYSDLMDKVNVTIYLEPKLPFKKKDVLLTIQYLKGMSKKKSDDGIILTIGSPAIEQYIKTMDQWIELKPEDYSYNEMSVLLRLNEFYYAGANLLVLDMKHQLEKIIFGLETDQARLKYLTRHKHHLLRNDQSYPTHFIKEIVAYCDAMMEEFKEHIKNEKTDGVIVSEELERIIKENVERYNAKVEGNNLLKPLAGGDFSLFVNRLQPMLLTPSSWDITEDDKERIYHVYILALMKGRLDIYTASSNKESGLGRYDILLLPSSNQLPAVIFETKKIASDGDTEKALTGALNQIDEKKYITVVKEAGINTVLKIGLVYTGLKPTAEFTVEEL